MIMTGLKLMNGNNKLLLPPRIEGSRCAPHTETVILSSRAAAALSPECYAAIPAMGFCT
jgi:hypothetical protein